MATEFQNSITKDNLMRAFAGESQARNRYTFAASQAKKNGMYVVSAVFAFTASQEKEHAEIFYNHLREMAGKNILIDGGYPVDLSDNVVDLLSMAQHNEYEEHDDVYKNFGDKAREEGFDQIAAVFHQIAEVEKIHGDRFGRFAQLLKEGRLFVSDVEEEWMCLNCGFVFRGTKAPEICPVCRHDQGYFIRFNLVPFLGKN
ncbi:MAG: rubrerythrin family protein [Lachnospiraceae bacterium]|jgi:rubrerythrin|nr:rubrerythrin family protein [Lachnospiraceae bacterium]